jgi:uncharacterized protein YjbI with pentapeptide repeats
MPDIEDFYTNADRLKGEYLLKAEDAFIVNRDTWIFECSVNFREACDTIRERQRRSTLAPITYLEYTMLYTNFVNREYFAEIIAYGDMSYLDKSQQFIGRFDISCLFLYYDALWYDLTRLKRRYLGKVSALEVTRYMQKAIAAFYSYLACIVRRAIAAHADKSVLSGIEKNDMFMVNVGDYMASTETAYREQKGKDAGRLSDWFYERLENSYIFGDYSSLDFSEKNFEYTDFRYASFRESSLADANLEGSSLVGVNFRNAFMEKCVFDASILYEADFSHASLKNASFARTLAKSGLANVKRWKAPGFLPVMFSHADLENADFTGANMKGAIFSRADLTGADFTDAILIGADFKGANLAGAYFTGAAIHGADFAGADISGVDLTKCV